MCGILHQTKYSVCKVPGKTVCQTSTYISTHFCQAYVYTSNAAAWFNDDSEVKNNRIETVHAPKIRIGKRQQIRITSRAVRRRRRAADADILLTPPPPFSWHVHAMLYTSYMLLYFCNAVYNESSTLTKSSKNDAGVFCNSSWYCAPTNWWSAAALGGLMTGGGGAPRIFHRRRRRGFMVGGGGGVRPDERPLKQRTRLTGVFSGFTGVSHFTCDLR